MELKKTMTAYILEVKEAIVGAIKKSGLSRAQIAEGINEMIGSDEDDVHVTVSQIDSWTKRDDRRTPFFKYLPIFCHVTGDCGPLQAYVGSLGLKIIADKDIPILDLGTSEIDELGP